MKIPLQIFTNVIFHILVVMQIISLSGIILLGYLKYVKYV